MGDNRARIIRYTVEYNTSFDRSSGTCGRDGWILRCLWEWKNKILVESGENTIVRSKIQPFTII